MEILKGWHKDERNCILKWHANRVGFLLLSANIQRQNIQKERGSWLSAAAVNLFSNCFDDLRCFSGWLRVRFGNHCFVSHPLSSTLPFFSWQNQKSSISISFATSVHQKSGGSHFCHLLPLPTSASHLPPSGDFITQQRIGSPCVLLQLLRSCLAASSFLPDLHTPFMCDSLSRECPLPFHLTDPTPPSKPSIKAFFRGTVSDHCPVYFLRHLHFLPWLLSQFYFYTYLCFTFLQVCSPLASRLYQVGQKVHSGFFLLHLMEELK